MNVVRNRASLSKPSRGLVASVAAVLAGAMAFTAVPAQGASTPGVSDTEIVLGMQLPQTGPASPGYNKVDDAMRAYFDYVNSKGLLDRFEVIAYPRQFQWLKHQEY